MEEPLPPSNIIITQNSLNDGYFANSLEVNEPPMRKDSSQECYAVKCAKPKIFFKDGVRSVDFVLVWDAFKEDAVKPDSYVKRQIFETNLQKEGLEIEYEAQEENGLNFVKVSVIFIEY